MWGGVSFHWSYHLVSVIPPLLSTIGGGGCCYSTLHATLLSAMGWGVHTHTTSTSTIYRCASFRLSRAAHSVHLSASIRFVAELFVAVVSPRRLCFPVLPQFMLPRHYFPCVQVQCDVTAPYLPVFPVESPVLHLTWGVWHQHKPSNCRAHHDSTVRAADRPVWISLLRHHVLWGTRGSTVRHSVPARYCSFGSARMLLL